MKRQTELKVSYEPHFIDLINTYFPAEYAKKYSDVEVLFKTVQALRLKNPPESDDYVDMCKVQEATQKLKENPPYITPTEVINHPTIRKIAGKYYAEKTLRKWIRPIPEKKPGRPRRQPAGKN